MSADLSSPDLPLAEFLELVALQLGTETVRAEDHLIEDLGAESADLLNLVANLEDRYAISIDEDQLPLLSTVAELYELFRRCADAR